MHTLLSFVCVVEIRRVRWLFCIATIFIDLTFGLIKCCCQSHRLIDRLAASECEIVVMMIVLLERSRRRRLSECSVCAPHLVIVGGECARARSRCLLMT